MTFVVSRFFDAAGGNFDDAAGLFDAYGDPLTADLSAAFDPVTSVLAAWEPAQNGNLSVSFSATSSVTAIFPTREQDLEVRFGGGAVESHEISYGTIGTYTDNDPQAPEPYEQVSA